jgi:hypothetical protein
MPHTPESEIATLLRVPNTPEGTAFLNQLRKYAVKGTRILARPRGPRVRHAIADGRWRASYRSDLPRQHAVHFAVYIRKPALAKLARDRESKYVRDLQNKILELTSPSHRQEVREEMHERFQAVFDLNPKRKIKLGEKT